MSAGSLGQIRESKVYKISGPVKPRLSEIVKANGPVKLTVRKLEFL